MKSKLHVTVTPDFVGKLQAVTGKLQQSLLHFFDEQIKIWNIIDKCRNVEKTTVKWWNKFVTKMWNFLRSGDKGAKHLPQWLGQESTQLNFFWPPSAAASRSEDRSKVSYFVDRRHHEASLNIWKKLGSKVQGQLLFCELFESRI